MLVQTLLHLGRLVWIVTASLIFDASAWAQKGRVATVKGKKTGFGRVKECERRQQEESEDENICTT